MNGRWRKCYGIEQKEPAKRLFEVFSPRRLVRSHWYWLERQTQS